MDFDDHVAAAIDKLTQATFGLWNALLTVNGIMLTVFSVLYVIGPDAGRGFIGVLIAFCVVSACLLVFNHWAMKVTYYRIGEVMADADRGVSVPEAHRERDRAQALRLHRLVRVSERACLLLFIAEVLIIAVFVYGLPHS
jgi:hypothetical protein